MSQIISLTTDTDGIAELRWNDPARNVNVFSTEAIDAWCALVESIASDDTIRGVLITSGKKVFHAGADLKMIGGFFDMTPDALWALIGRIKDSFYRLETCGKPVASAINGHCLGGGFEMALASHARFACDDPAIRIGLPEAGLGLMPGFGGTQRMPRLAPWQRATEDMLQGKTYDVVTAKSLKLLTDVVAADDLYSIAKTWLLANPNAEQPWTARDYRGPATTAGYEQFFYKLNADLSHGDAAKRPEQRLIAEAVYHGLQMPIEPALRLEVRRFIELTRIPAVKETMQSRFFGAND